RQRTGARVRAQLRLEMGGNLTEADWRRCETASETFVEQDERLVDGGRDPAEASEHGVDLVRRLLAHDPEQERHVDLWSVELVERHVLAREGGGVDGILFDGDEHLVAAPVEVLQGARVDRARL